MHLFWKCTCPKPLRWDALDRLVILYPHELFSWWFSCLFEMLLCPLRVVRMFSLPGMSDNHHCWILWSWDVFLKWTISGTCLSKYGFCFIKEPILLRLKIHLKLYWKDLVVAFRWQWLKRHTSFIFKKNVVYHVIVSVSNPQSVYYDIYRVFNRPSIVQTNSD